jgi:hypothetical protein
MNLDMQDFLTPFLFWPDKNDGSSLFFTAVPSICGQFAEYSLNMMSYEEIAM